MPWPAFAIVSLTFEGGSPSASLNHHSRYVVAFATARCENPLPKPGVSLRLTGLGRRQGPPTTADAENASYLLSWPPL